jgi:hypothetical protein
MEVGVLTEEAPAGRRAFAVLILRDKESAYHGENAWPFLLH